MLKYVESNLRVQWDTFTNQSEFDSKFKINVGVATVSDDMINVMLSHREWRGVRYVEDGQYKIGYGFGDPDFEQGMTETEAYAEFVGRVRNTQKIVRAQLPIISIPNSVYDALISLYVDTGTWRTVVADEGTYDLADAIKNSNWLLAADILSRGKVNPDLRRKEAAVLYLADYSFTKDRNQQIINGIQQMRKAYINGYANEFDKRQAEYAYYRQLNVFLPNMSQLRQRRIVNTAI